MQCADEAVAQMRLHLGKFRRRERDGIDTQFARPFGLGEIRVERRRIVVSPDKSDRAQERGRARLLGKLLMLRGAGRDQRDPLRRDLGIAAGFRVAPISEQWPKQARQGRQVVIGIDGTVARDPPQLGDGTGKRVRKHRLALHQPAIAIGGFLARRPPVDQHDLLAALLQMHRDGDADHAGAENHHIAVQYAHSAARRFFALGQRAAASGSTSSIRRRVCAIISSSPLAAGRRINFETPAAT